MRVIKAPAAHDADMSTSHSTWELHVVMAVPYTRKCFNNTSQLGAINPNAAWIKDGIVYFAKPQT